MKVADIKQLNISALLPSPKGVALALLEACRKEDITIGEITKLIQTDPALSGRLIHKANLAGQSARPITSVSEGVSRVGLAVVKQLALGFSLIDQYQGGPCKGFNYQQFWSHSLLMAIAMQELGKIIRVCPVDELFACGLMTRIGCLALATIYPGTYTELLEKQNSSASLTMLEQEFLETDHNQLTAAMLINFGVPNIMVEPIYYHESPNESGFSEGSRPYQIVHLLFLAKQIADLGISLESEHSKRTSDLMLLGSKIGLDTESFGHLIDQIMQDWQQWSVMLKLPAVAPPSFQKMANTQTPRPEDTIDASSLRVLLVEDELSSRLLTEGILNNILGHTVHTAVNGKEALATAIEVQPHIIITDWVMPAMDGLELTRSIRSTDWGQNIYIIMLTSLENEEDIVEAFDAGVDDYVSKPINLRAFRARLRAAWHYRQLQESWERDREQLKRFAAELAVTNRKLEHIALTDMLTELPNRRAGMNALSETWSNSERSDQSMAVMLIDIDYFKKINDTYGHATGDRVLIEIASLIRSNARKGDAFCRMGGEEFLIICQSGCNEMKSTVQFAERLRQYTKAHPVKIDENFIEVSISIGIAQKEVSAKNPDQLINLADKALYAAKNAGRNKVFLAIENKLINCSNPS